MDVQKRIEQAIKESDERINLKAAEATVLFHIRLKKFEEWYDKKISHIHFKTIIKQKMKEVNWTDIHVGFSETGSFKFAEL